MALMAKHGEIDPMPSAAIFADTKAETKNLYSWLSWLEKQLPFPVHKVANKESLTDANLQFRVSKKSGKKYWRNFIPFFVADDQGKKGILMRKCTRDFKVSPLLREVKRLAGIKRGGNELVAISWIGISKDEMTRMKASLFPYVENRWPLIEKGMTRMDCLKWMEDNGYPKPPRSACSYCPYHSNKEWQRIKTEEPEHFEEAVIFEKEAQKYADGCEVIKGKPFLHASLKPLGEIEFQDKKNQFEFSWMDECEGMCGN